MSILIGLAFAAFGMAALTRFGLQDLRRLKHPIVWVEAEVVSNESPSGFWFVEGPTARLHFTYRGKDYSVLHTFQTPAEVGSTSRLSFPEGYPADARERQVSARSMLYAMLVLFTGLGIAMALGLA